MWIYWGTKWKEGKKNLSSWVGICWVRQFYAGSLSSQYWLLKNRPWAWTHPHQEIKNPHGPCWVYHFAWNIFPCFRFHVFSTVLLKRVQYMVPGQSHCNSGSCRDRTGSFCYSTRRECASQLLCIGCLGLAGPREALPTSELMLLYPFPPSNPVLSLMTLIKTQWGKVSLNFRSW